MVLSIAVACLTLAAVGSSSLIEARGSRPARYHSPVEVVRDANGDAVRSFDTKYVSGNWSGYVLPHFQTKQQYFGAQTTWTVPTVTYRGIEAASSSWIGIGGFCVSKKCREIDQTLIQVGTEQDVFGPNVDDTQYYAWYEMLPDAEVPTSLTVSPGDVVTATMSCADGCADGEWTLSMANDTTAQGWIGDFIYRSPNLSMEVIQEAPTSGGVLPLADYDRVSFSDSMANSMNVNFSKGDSLVMEDRQRHKVIESSNVSALGSNENDFNACFNNKKQLAKCPKP